MRQCTASRSYAATSARQTWRGCRMTKPKKGYRSSKRGSYMIDREIPGGARIHMASGLTNAAQFRILNDGITELKKTPDGVKILLALLDGTITPLALFYAIRA